MKILAISDVDQWKGYQALHQTIAPDVVVLPGDLVQDGSSLIAGVCPDKHGEGFYSFLKRAGKTSKVLVVAGNHDQPPAYNLERISSIPGCEEISGRAVSLQGVRFLGVGYSQAHLIRDLYPLIESHKDKVDVVLSHCEGRRLRELGALRPKLIIQGHFGVGQYTVYGVPTVFTSQARSTVIDISRLGKISIKVVHRESHLAIRAFVRHPSLVPHGNQGKHDKACYRCNPRWLDRPL